MGLTKDKNGIEKKGCLLLKVFSFPLYFIDYLTCQTLDQGLDRKIKRLKSYLGTKITPLNKSILKTLVGQQHKGGTGD